MSPGPEFQYVEGPFIDQLVGMGWKFTTGNLDHPSATGREAFGDVLLLDDLREAVLRINRDDSGQEWLDRGRQDQAISAIQRLGVHKLMEANQAATELLLKGTTVEGLPEWDGGRNQTVHYIDWTNPENNTFRVINQFRVDEPGGQAHRYIVPDLVLFVNGIPLVAVECKSPGVVDPLEEAINQLQRYSNQREWVEGNEGNERLFHYNQVMVATCFDRAVVGTVGARAVHYLEWKDTTPYQKADVAAELGKEALSSQETLIAGMLRPELLLDIVRHFTLFILDTGRVIKIVTRYQQFRAVQLAAERLLTGKTREEDGEYDRRGGIIWHTQGSGKSLTMVFLIRKMRSLAELRRFKVVAVTDRKDLEKQLSETAELTGETVRICRSKRHLKEVLAEKGPGLVFAMIHKYHQRLPDFYGDDEVENEEAIEAADGAEDFPVLNTDDSILVLVDEAHRSHATSLHANLMAALPNCAKIGFTGTPIIMGARKRTHEIFGPFIDRYDIRQSEDDGSTVPILYEGRTAKGAVKDGRDLDEVFEDMFEERTPEELELIKQKYATTGHVMEAPELIAAKAKNILQHYVEKVLPNGFKAQIVAVSRRATIRYYEALNGARAELVRELDVLDPRLTGLGEEEIEGLSKRNQFLARAHFHLDILRELEFAPVISGDHNDPPEWATWTDRSRSDAHIARFKKPLIHEDPQKRDPLGFLIVKSMLLTGFDAPVEQVMYLDRHMKEHELLQAIARVNRTYPKKQAGLVVDYYGVAHHLKEALAVYADEDIEGALRSLQDEIPKLRDQHRRAVLFFTDKGVEGIDDTEACVALLEEVKHRAEFHVVLKQFLETLDLVLPRPEALPFVKDARTLAFIQARATNRYRDPQILIGKEVGEKVRKLIDDHIVSLGIDPKVPPISVMASDFDDHVEKEKSPRARASEMEHAIRSHIRQHFQEDPEYYQRLSERLEEILTSLEAHWDELVEALKEYVREVQQGRPQDDTGLDPTTQAPFLGLLRQELKKAGEGHDDRLERLVPVTVDLVDHVREEIRLVGFWGSAQKQEELRNWIVRFLDTYDLLPLDRLPQVADRMVELARVNHHKLIEP
ncbi:type I restriction endonuclease subunit R [Gemmatimonadota bacterium]